MDVDAVVKSIRSIYITISGKQDPDFMLIYRGTNGGITKPWKAMIDGREVNHETHEGALSELLYSLKNELEGKVKSAEREVHRLRDAFSQLGN
jgi:hypothetical protein